MPSGESGCKRFLRPIAWPNRALHPDLRIKIHRRSGLMRSRFAPNVPAAADARSNRNGAGRRLARSASQTVSFQARGPRSPTPCRWRRRGARMILSTPLHTNVLAANGWRQPHRTVALRASREGWQRPIRGGDRNRSSTMRSYRIIPIDRRFFFAGRNVRDVAVVRDQQQFDVPAFELPDNARFRRSERVAASPSMWPTSTSSASSASPLASSTARSITCASSPRSPATDG